MECFSPCNPNYMQSFVAAWRDRSIVQALLAQLTWYHNLRSQHLYRRIEDAAIAQQPVSQVLAIPELLRSFEQFFRTP